MSFMLIVENITFNWSFFFCRDELAPVCISTLNKEILRVQISPKYENFKNDKKEKENGE